MSPRVKHETPADTKHRLVKFEENIKLDLVGRRDSKDALKFEAIEDEDGKLDTVMVDVSTCSDDLIQDFTLHDSNPYSLTILTEREYADHKPSVKITGLDPKRAASEPILSDPRIIFNRHAKSEPIEVDRKQPLIKCEQRISDAIPTGYMASKREPSPDGNYPEYKAINHNLRSVNEEKPKIKREGTIMGTSDSHINVDSDVNQGDDMPLALEHPPAPRYETVNYIDNFGVITATAEHSQPIDPTLNGDAPEINIGVIDPRTTRNPTADSAQPELQMDDSAPLVTNIPRNNEGVPHTKRKRVLFDAVVLQKLSSFKAIDQPPVVNAKVEPTDITKMFIKPEPVSEDDKVKLEFLRNNPDVKIKEETVLGDEGVAYRLRALGPGGLDPYPIDLEDNIKMATVTRAWMSDTYGGDRRSGCPKINKKKFKHGIDNFRYINYESCPNAPRIPGAPGLMLGCWGSEDETYKNQRVIMRTNHGQWLPMGIYDCIPSNPLSREEWNAQSPAFRIYWASEISFKKWAAPARVRIGLRDDLGREPTAEEYERALQNGSYKELSVDLIREAFALGQEVMSVWCMKCVGYDTNFQRAIAKMPKDYTPSNKNTKGRRKETLVEATLESRKVKAKPMKTVVSRKRKRQGA